MLTGQRQFKTGMVLYGLEGQLTFGDFYFGLEVLFFQDPTLAPKVCIVFSSGNAPSLIMAVGAVRSAIVLEGEVRGATLDTGVVLIHGGRKVSVEGLFGSLTIILIPNRLQNPPIISVAGIDPGHSCGATTIVGRDGRRATGTKVLGINLNQSQHGQFVQNGKHRGIYYLGRYTLHRNCFKFRLTVFKNAQGYP